jgi:two-component sensor histidine kinase
MALDRMRMRLAVMAMVQDQALRSPDSPIVDMTQFLQDVAANVAASHQETCQRIERRVSSADCPFAPDRAVALGLAAAELIDNAYRHAFASVDSGVLTITLDDDGCAGSFRLVVEDDGEGEPKPGGVGLEIVEALASQLGGSVSWTTSAGTRVELSGGPGA